jgi:uncharacterized membrane protein YtjA (UPF0391 family)
VLGFGGIAAASAGVAKALFFLFLVLCVIFFSSAREAEEFRKAQGPATISEAGLWYRGRIDRRRRRSNLFTTKSIGQPKDNYERNYICETIGRGL